MQNQTKNIIIAVIGVVLIISGVFYYQKNKSVSMPKEIGISPIEEGNNVPGTQPDSIKDSLSSGVTVDSGENKAKFNTAMSNARIAFRNKDYPQAIAYYNQALSYEKADTSYAGLFSVYGAQGDWINAQLAIDSAIKLNPKFTDYWVSKLGVLDEKTGATYQDLKNVYSEGLLKVDLKTKINLVTYFAGIAERNGQIPDSISLWTYAQNLYPENTSIYQGEINRLQGI